MKRLREVPNWIIVAGAVAGAVVSIAAAYRIFVPEKEPAPAIGRATMSGLQVDPRVKLADFLESTKPASAVTRPRFVSVGLAASEPGAGSPSGTEPAPSPPQPAPTTPADPPTGSPSPGSDPNPTADQALQQDLGQQRVDVQSLLNTTSGDPIEQIQLPQTVSGSAKARIATFARRAMTGDPGASYKKVRQALAGTQLGPISRAGADQRDLLVPYGAVVNLVVEPEGYERRKLSVRWTLFDARTRKRIPRRWLNRRLALKFTPRRNVDRVDVDFWVPRPAAFRGPFFIRIELFDDEDVRLRRKEARFR